VAFAALRYSLPSPAWFRLPCERGRSCPVSRRTWWRVGLLGLLFYGVTQGSGSSAAWLPAVAVNMMLSFTAVWSRSWGPVLRETPALQLAGVACCWPEQAVFLPVRMDLRRVGTGSGSRRCAGQCLLHSWKSGTGAASSPIWVTAVSIDISSATLMGWAAVSGGFPPLAAKDPDRCLAGRGQYGRSLHPMEPEPAR
jgi:hypothetical protein